MARRVALWKPDLKPGSRSRRPAFSDESSDTEYTSSSSEEASHDNGNCVGSESKVTPCSQEQPTQAPHENLAIVPKSDIKSENLVTSRQGSSLKNSPFTCGVLNGKIVAPSSLTIQRVGIKCTPLKERHEVDKNGKAIIVVDLGDSDEETDVPLHRLPLCTACQHKQHDAHVTKVAEKDEGHTPKLKIVVDLSVTSSQVNDAHVAARKVPRLQNGEISLGAMAPFSSRANGKQLEAEMGFGVEKMKTVSLKANGKQVEAKIDFSKEKMTTVSWKANGSQVVTKLKSDRELVKSVTESSLKLRSRIPLSPEVLKASSEKVRDTVLPEAEESEDEASTLSEDYRRGLAEGHHAEMIVPDWSPGVLCDLCELGASLSLGAWYSWCCGNPSLGCSCSFDDVQRKKKALLGKGGKNWKPTDPPYPWSGKVHKLCGLWSAEVFEDSKHPWRILRLGDAVRRSRKIKCSDPDCGLFGATLGCRVSSCKRSFHYPCADRLSAFVKLRIWDGLMKPVACKEHRHVDDIFEDVKVQKETKKEARKRKRQRKSLLPLSGAGSSKVGVRISNGADVIEIEGSDEEGSPHGATVQDAILRLNTPNNLDSRFALARTTDTSGRWLKNRNSGPAYLGKNLLCKDFSGGLEPIEVPCTNDVDSEPPPYLEYITKSRYQGQPLGSRDCSHPLLEKRAKACNGCAMYDPDDPTAPLSVHIPFQRREDDFREDWLRERMYGRLPYDKYARIVIGTDYNELVECNDRCKCGDDCINREMQKGLRTPIELYKTKNKGWAVRALVPIPRGRFVIEYVGEMLTQDQAQRYGQIYDEIKRSYLYDLDYPESRRTPDFTLDGFHASNVARFINHSCDANLKIYRVYVETTYKWLSHIGMYAMRDIEPGEELSYDYNYGRHELQAHDGKSNNPEAGKQKIEHENDSTHIKCYCGAKNCREWLWRPMHTGEDSEDE